MNMSVSVPAPAAVVVRIRAEFLEMPDLRLTVREAARFWQIDLRMCASLLGSLVEQGVLKRTSAGAFTRVSR